MKQITEDYVSFETAKLLKEKGFPQDYDKYHGLVYNEEDYEDEYEIQRMVLETRQVKAGTLHSYPLGVPEPKCYCPTQSLALKWLREVHGILIRINEYGYPCKEKGRQYTFTAKIRNMKSHSDITQFLNDKPEQAVEEAIKYALENSI